MIAPRNLPAHKERSYDEPKPGCTGVEPGPHDRPLPRPGDRVARPALRAVPPRRRGGRAAVDRRALGRGAGLVWRRALPTVLRYPERPDHALERRHWRGDSVPRA